MFTNLNILRSLNCEIMNFFFLKMFKYILQNNFNIYIQVSKLLHHISLFINIFFQNFVRSDIYLGKLRGWLS